jgi:hypothetical protein
MMHEADRVIVEIRNQLKTLQALLHYLESQGLWSEDDLRYCRNTLRRSARDLLTISRGPLGSIDLVVMKTAA